MASIVFWRPPEGMERSRSINNPRSSVCRIKLPIPPSTGHYEKTLTKTRAIIIGFVNLFVSAFLMVMCFIKIDKQIETKNSICHEPSQDSCHQSWSLMDILSSEIWFGIIFGVSGVFTLLAGYRTSRWIGLSCLIFALISVITSLFLFFYSVIWHSVSLVISIVQGLASFVCLIMISRDTCRYKQYVSNNMI